MSELKKESKKDLYKIKPKAWLHYFYDSEHLESRLKPMFSTPIILENKETKETVNLTKVSYYLKGIPVYMCRKEMPMSLSLEFNKNNNKLIESGYSTTEFNAILNSTTFNSAFRKNRISSDFILLVILSIILSVCLTMLVYSMIVIPSVQEQILNQFPNQNTFTLISILKFIKG